MCCVIPKVKVVWRSAVVNVLNQGVKVSTLYCMIPQLKVVLRRTVLTKEIQLFVLCDHQRKSCLEKCCC